MAEQPMLGRSIQLDNRTTKQPIVRKPDFLTQLKTAKDAETVKVLKRKKRKEDYHIRMSFKRALEDFELYKRWEEKQDFKRLAESTRLKDVFGKWGMKGKRGYTYSDRVTCPDCGKEFTWHFASPHGKAKTKGVTFGVKT